MNAFLAFFRRRWVLGSFAVLVVAGSLAWWLRREDNLNVPLGVEQAAIITYTGPGLVVKPFHWGVAVNVRIAQVTQHGASKVYDVRYLVNIEGDHDLIGYLMTDNGTALTGLPSFKVHGDPKLSKELEARVRETEAVGIEVRGHYKATLVVLFILWIGWLLMLIFYGRAKKAVEVLAALSRLRRNKLKPYFQSWKAANLRRLRRPNLKCSCCAVGAMVSWPPIRRCVKCWWPSQAESKRVMPYSVCNVGYIALARKWLK